MYPKTHTCTACARLFPAEQDYCTCGRKVWQWRQHPNVTVEKTGLQRLIDGTAWQQYANGQHQHARIGSLEIDLYSTAGHTQLIINCDLTGRQYVNATFLLPMGKAMEIATAITSTLVITSPAQ
jgi:hypothetical protein